MWSQWYYWFRFLAYSKSNSWGQIMVDPNILSSSSSETSSDFWKTPVQFVKFFVYSNVIIESESLLVILLESKIHSKWWKQLSCWYFIQYSNSVEHIYSFLLVRRLLNVVVYSFAKRVVCSRTSKTWSSANILLWFLHLVEDDATFSKISKITQVTSTI